MEYSQTVKQPVQRERSSCLNPYSNGILTDYETEYLDYAQQVVLILILMEYSQTLKREEIIIPKLCLNPYSNGILTDYFSRYIV